MVCGATSSRNRGVVLDTTESIVVGGLAYEASGTLSRLRRARDPSAPQPSTAPAARLPLPFTELVDRESELELLRAPPPRMI